MRFTHSPDSSRTRFSILVFCDSFPVKNFVRAELHAAIQKCAKWHVRLPPDFSLVTMIR